VTAAPVATEFVNVTLARPFVTASGAGGTKGPIGGSPSGLVTPGSETSGAPSAAKLLTVPTRSHWSGPLTDELVSDTLPSPATAIAGPLALVKVLPVKVAEETRPMSPATKSA
jgi:hypothetical protein